FSAACWSACLWPRIVTTSSSTTRSWPRAIFFGYRIGEVSCPARYEPDSSSIDFRRSLIYGLGVLWTSVQFVLQRLGLARFAIFDPNGRRLASSPHYAEPKQDRAEA
ncbi:MAG: hypothetical protein J3T61_04055, partial [Candidatus Brocadiales bacterium]|nr:hypothetical protein [Candidatus Bathyanammoxibius sp.]